MAQSTPYKFRLYVASDAVNSAQAITNLQAICRTYLPERHEIEIVDVFKDPRLALAERVFMTPTLIRVAPGPERRIVGTLNQTDIVLQSLGLDPDSCATP